MKVFISWSGVNSTSHKVAEALSGWLPLVFDNVQCFFSSADIGPGTVWMESLFDQLKDSQFGIICVTPKLMSKASAWMFFETGALAKEMSTDRSRVVPLMIDVPATQLLPPLHVFQGVSADKDGIRQLVNSLATAGGPTPEIVDGRFRALWPALKADIDSALAADSNPAERVPRRPTDDILGDILEQLKVLESRVASLTSQVASATTVPAAPLSTPVTVTVGPAPQSSPSREEPG